MDALTVSSVPSTFQQRRRLKRNDYEPIPSKYMAVLAHHLSGKTVRMICDLTGYKSPTIYKILSDERVVQIRQQLMKVTESEFEALYANVVQVIRSGLTDADMDIALRSADMWLKAHGKYKSTQTVQNITAEDVVIQILNQARGENGSNA